MLSPPPLLPLVPGSAAFALALLAVSGDAAAAEAYVGGGVGTEEKEKGDVAAADAGPLRPSWPCC